MSDLKIGDRVTTPTDPAAYDGVALQRNYFDPTASDDLYSNEEKAKLLGGRVGTLDDIAGEIAMVNLEATDLDVSEVENPVGIAFGVPLDSLAVPA